MLMGWLNGLIKNIPNFTEMLVTAYALFAIGMIFISILLPLVYKFGVERSRVIILAIIAIPTAAFLVMAQTDNAVLPNEQTIRQALLLSPVVIVVCGIVSFMISHGIYRRKEV